MQGIIDHPTLPAALLVAVAAAITDLRSRTVPNALTAAGAVLGLFVNAWSDGAAGLGRSALGLLVGAGVFLPFFLLRGMGGGDVKLMGALGACLGALPVLRVALVASLVGALFAVAAAFARGLLKRTLANTGRLLWRWVRKGPQPSAELSLDNPMALKIPYAVPIAIGAAVIVITG